MPPDSMPANRPPNSPALTPFVGKAATGGASESTRKNIVSGAGTARLRSSEALALMPMPPMPQLQPLTAWPPLTIQDASPLGQGA